MPRTRDLLRDGRVSTWWNNYGYMLQRTPLHSGIVIAQQTAAAVSRANRRAPAAKEVSTLCRLLLVMGLFAAVFVNIVPECAAQDVSITTLRDTSGIQTENLAFSKDGRLLREIQLLSPSALGKFSSVRAITYDATTGSKKHCLNLGPDTAFLSATSDGGTAVIGVNRFRNDARAHVVLADMETGESQDIPNQWFDADDDRPYAQISTDGRIVSAYTESDPQYGRVVTLYEWRTKKLVAKQSEAYPAGGISWGGVTADGKIEFLNNRSGGDVVDPKTGRVLVKVTPNSHRSPDGRWAVEYPNTIADGVPREVVIKNGRSGEEVGKLELQMADDNELESWAWARGTFCGMSGRFVAAASNTVQVFAIPSGKRLADFPIKTWQDTDPTKTDSTAIVGCSFNGKRVAIRSGTRLTLHDLK